MLNACLVLQLRVRAVRQGRFPEPVDSFPPRTARALGQLAPPLTPSPALSRYICEQTHVTASREPIVFHTCWEDHPHRWLSFFLASPLSNRSSDTRIGRLGRLTSS